MDNSAVGKEERLDALRRAKLLDTPPEQAFDRLTELAAKLLAAPAAFISLVDRERQFFKSAFGKVTPEADEATETPLDASFCQYAIGSREPLVVEDARQHPVLSTNKALENGVVSYAGVPLVTAEGHGLGALCVVDSKPRSWSKDDLDKLSALASSVQALIEYRQAALSSGPMEDEDEGLTSPLLALVRAHFENLDAYDALMANGGGTPDFLVEEARLRRAAAESRSRMEDEAQRIRKLVPTRSAPIPGDDEELLSEVADYVNAEEQRTRTASQFAQNGAALADVEVQANRAMHAEQALRFRLYRLDAR